MLSIKEARNAKALRKYQSYDGGRFVENKTFRIDKVRHGRIDQVKNIKIDARIVYDEDQGLNYKDYKDDPVDQLNFDKVVTLRIDNENDVAFERINDELEDKEGCLLTVEPEDVDKMLVMGKGLVNIIIDGFSIDEFQRSEPSKKITSSERQVYGLTQYQSFDIADFIHNESVALMGAHPSRSRGEKLLHIDGFILNQESGVFDRHITIEMPIHDFDNLPFRLLMMKGSFNDVIMLEQSEFERAIPSHQFTRWKLRFKSIAFQPDVLSDDVVRLSEDTGV